MPALVAAVNRALIDISCNSKKPASELVALKPAVQISKSITPDYIACLEDGARFTSLKRHLRARHSLTDAEYREKWRLPADYPMVAPNYKNKRANIAKAFGLGRRGAVKKS
ncbi:MAG: MucR family transcriptional regulator [Parvibaculaceae bacterium]